MSGNKTHSREESKALLTIPFDTQILGKLLACVGVSVLSGKLEQACAAAQPEGFERKPSDRLL